MSKSVQLRELAIEEKEVHVRGPGWGVLAVLIMGSGWSRSMEVCAGLNSCPGGILTLGTLGK